MKTEALKLLLIEDNEDDAFLIQRELRRSCNPSPEVTHATTLADALVRVSGACFDVVLLDLNLPDSGGLDTFDALHGAAPQVPVVVLSGMEDEETAVSSVRKGAQDYLAKGNVGGGLVARAVEYAVERGRLTAELLASTERLGESESRFRTIIEHNVDGIIITGLDNQVLYANPSACRMFGSTPEAFIGTRFMVPLSSEGLARVDLPSREDERTVGEIRTVRTLWQDRPARLSAIRDVSDQVRAARLEHELEAQTTALEHMRELERMKSDFVETVTHELRTPMTPLRSTVDMFLDGMLGDLNEKQTEFMKMMGRNIERLSRFATDVLEMSRLESGTTRIVPRVIDLGETLEPVVGLLDQKGADQDVSVRLETSGERSAWADPDGVSEVVNNLVDNALKHARGATRIIVRVNALDRDAIQVQVEDDGCGIPASARERVFDRFFQVDRQSGPGYRGSGIGLSVCRLLVERMEGHITVESAPDMGTRFVFSLPRRPPQREVLFGRIAIARGFVTQEQVDRVANLQARSPQRVQRIGDLFIAEGLMTPAQRDVVMAEQAVAYDTPHALDHERPVADLLFGSIALSQGYITEEQLHTSLRTRELLLQSGRRERLGETLVRFKYLTEAQVSNILDLQGLNEVVCSHCGGSFNRSAQRARLGASPACPDCALREVARADSDAALPAIGPAAFEADTLPFGTDSSLIRFVEEQKRKRDSEE